MSFSAARMLRRFFHYGPLTASFIIFLVTIMTIVCILASTPITTFRLPNGRSSWEHVSFIKSGNKNLEQICIYQSQLSN